jgi:hypothetical protein
LHLSLALLRIEVNASLKTLASESPIRFMAALRRTTEAPPRPTITDECQFFLDNVVAQFGQS